MTEAAVVDDYEPDALSIKECLLRFEEEANGNLGNKEVKFNVTLFASGNEFLKSKKSFDLVFFDIDMPDINGIDTAKRLREENSDVCIIFVTNMAQYALQGYDVNALDFIVKPINYYNFSLKLKKALHYLFRNSSKTISVMTTAREIVNLETSDITYIEVLNHILIYHLADSSSYECRGSMNEIEEKMSSYSFSRASKSFLVNLKHMILSKETK